ncbi:hypothetical protein HYC85_003201 [Camellia sinensis]|uniref:Uncharacterized protein n=1 Tax=Camellia sinensis TaxID=4442 RepID=A0A7J7IAN5_CAMSI|nr:hypothetical protein HYC85_003201 [Camellia sinensis]
MLFSPPPPPPPPNQSLVLQTQFSLSSLSTPLYYASATRSLRRAKAKTNFPIASLSLAPPSLFRNNLSLLLQNHCLKET